jgi:hypothetical protein
MKILIEKINFKDTMVGAVGLVLMLGRGVVYVLFHGNQVLKASRWFPCLFNV